jgi:adenylyltransferase/sulfurtransferase
MVVIFLIPGPLRLYTAGASTVQLDVSAATVEEALGALWERFPGVRDRVVTEQGEVREYVNIFVGNENIRDSGGLATPVRDGCEIMIVPSVAGGCDG